jgi:hypothetical protein
MNNVKLNLIANYGKIVERAYRKPFSVLRGKKTLNIFNKIKQIL